MIQGRISLCPRQRNLGSSRVHYHQPHLRHLLDRIPDPFPAETGTFYPSIGHMVGAIGRHVVYDHAAGLDGFEGTEGVSNGDRVRFLGRPMQVPFAETMFGRGRF